MKAKRKKIVAVIGGHCASKSTQRLAYTVGAHIAQLGALLVCGGLGGVMYAAARGAKDHGGTTIGILPGENKNDANEFIDIALPTGIGYVRNTLVVSASDCLVAFKGKYGTLSEIAFALNMGKPVIGLGSWDIEGMIKAKTPQQAYRYLRKYIS